jgi:hypothetical protein
MNIDRTISQPSDFYDSPGAILKDEHLSRKDKIKALENWKQTCMHLQESAAEGMDGANKTENEDLKLISEALNTIKEND